MALLLVTPLAAFFSRSAWGFSGGPPAGTTGAPGERTCGACHRGPLALPDSLRVETVPYQPGRPQTIRITASDLGGAYGFQASMRYWTGELPQAGRFRALEGQRVACATGDFGVEVEKTLADCPASHPLEYVMHANPLTSPVVELEWTPPARTTEPVVLYVAFNSVNKDGSFGGDRYQQTAVLIPAARVRSSSRL